MHSFYVMCLVTLSHRRRENKIDCEQTRGERKCKYLFKHKNICLFMNFMRIPTIFRQFIFQKDSCRLFVLLLVCFVGGSGVWSTEWSKEIRFNSFGLCALALFQTGYNEPNASRSTNKTQERRGDKANNTIFHRAVSSLSRLFRIRLNWPFFRIGSTIYRCVINEIRRVSSAPIIHHSRKSIYWNSEVTSATSTDRIGNSFSYSNIDRKSSSAFAFDRW